MLGITVAVLVMREYTSPENVLKRHLAEIREDFNLKVSSVSVVKGLPPIPGRTEDLGEVTPTDYVVKAGGKPLAQKIKERVKEACPDCNMSGPEYAEIYNTPESFREIVLVGVTTSLEGEVRLQVFTILDDTPTWKRVLESLIP